MLDVAIIALLVLLIIISAIRLVIEIESREILLFLRLTLIPWLNNLNAKFNLPKLPGLPEQP